MLAILLGILVIIISDPTAGVPTDRAGNLRLVCLLVVAIFFGGVTYRYRHNNFNQRNSHELSRVIKPVGKCLRLVEPVSPVDRLQ